MNYSKLIGALVGNVIAIAIVYAASKGLAVCTTPGAAETCPLLGFSTAQVTGAAMMVFNSAFVYFFPPNVA